MENYPKIQQLKTTNMYCLSQFCGSGIQMWLGVWLSLVVGRGWASEGSGRLETRWTSGSLGKGTCREGLSEPHPGPPAPQEFSHPVESLALTVEEVMDVRRVLVKAEMEKFLQNKELFSSLKKGKVRRPAPCPAPRPLEPWVGAWRGQDWTQ